MNPIKEVYRALVIGFHDVHLSSGEILQSSTLKPEGTPSLVWGLAGWESNVFQAPWSYSVGWNMPARLTIQNEPGNPDALLDVLADLDTWCGMIGGLPVDKDGVLVPWGSERFEKLYRDGGLFAIAERFTGPILNRITVLPNATEVANSIADLIFRVDFIVDSKPKAEAKAMLFQVGANIFTPGHPENMVPEGEPYTLPVPDDADTRVQGAFAKPDTTLKIGNQVVYASFPPVVQNKPRVDGTDDPVASIDVLPRSASIAALATQQLSAIAHHVSGIAEVPVFAWATSDALVATVDTSGLVTGVGAGSCSITASFGGATGSAAITVS